MQIKPNYFLKPTDRNIKLWDRDIISVDGPNIIDKVSLDDIAIGYSDFYTSRQVLKSNTNNIPLYFDGIEEELIFLLVRVRKDTNHDPNHIYDITKNITYYFSDNTGNTFSIGELFIQTGSYQNKVKKIYFNNNNNFDVVLDVFGSILEKIDDISIINTGKTIYKYLYLEDIISNRTATEFVDDDYIDDYFLYVTGSTALQIISGDTITYSGITNIVKSGSTRTIYITTNTHLYELIFLTDFDFNQAYSRIMFVMDLPIYRFLTEDYIFENNSGETGINTNAPSILYNDGTGVTYSIPSGATLRGTYTKNEILKYFISSVIDDFDGVLDITGATSKLNKLGSFVSLTGATEIDYIYELSFTYTNSANNSASGTISYIYINLDPDCDAGSDGVV